MITFDNVSRSYGPKLAVDRLQLQISRGEVFAYLGPNGAGKTTTIKMLVGLLQPSAGSISVDGIEYRDDARLVKAKLGYVPDQPELYDKLSGREFIQFVADMRGMSRVESALQLEELIEFFEMRDYIDSLTESYSHGMKQRVAFSAALVHDPDALILDEPMVGLDPRAMRQVKELLRDRADRNKTVLLSTHTLAVAEQIADRIGVIHNGRLLFLGTVDQLRTRLSLGDSSLEDLYLALTQDVGDRATTPEWQQGEAG